MAGSFILTVAKEGGVKRRLDLPAGVYVIGRSSSCDVVTNGRHVSRRHAKVTLEDDGLVVEDIGSTVGTFVDGEVLKEAKRFEYPREFQVGSVVMRAERQEQAASSWETWTLPPEREVSITATLDASVRGELPVQGMAARVTRRLEMLYDLPLKFAAETDLKGLSTLILTQVMKLIPGAKRGALLVTDPDTDVLALRASVPADDPPVSRTLIRRAAEEQQGFIWSEDSGDGNDLSASIINLHIRTGMYAPMLWRGRTVGVLCVDNPRHSAVFGQEDLQFLIFVANYAAAAIANQQLQHDIEQNNRTLQHLLANFSPKLRGKLLQKSREGKLQPGGEKSDVTILMSDLRGFTRTSAAMDAEEVVEMLNDYFSVLADIIFQHDGTIDKFVGDAILAVFGSPEPDERHEHNAVRCAMAMRDQIPLINKRRTSAGLPTCQLGIGVHTGEVLHGFIGAAERLEFTVIGDTVNKACRYCDGTGAGEILIGPRTMAAVQDSVSARPKSIQTKHEGEMEAFFIM